MNAKEMFKNQGFNQIIYNENWVVYSNGSDMNSLGNSVIEIYSGGSFEAYEVSNHEYNDPLPFSSEMTKALMQQIKEFEKK